jgi:hypothetical protein
MEHAVTTLSRRSSKIAAAAAAFAAVALAMPAAHAAGEPAPGSIKIAYDPPANASQQRVYAIVREHNSLEMLREIFTPFRLPEDLQIRMTNCNGVPNAYFSRDKDLPTIRICYEYLQQVYQMMPKAPTPEGITPREALVGQLVFAVAHEFGHAVFDIYNVPVFGRQEDAADQFATYFLLQFGGERAQRLIWGAAYAYHEYMSKVKDEARVTLSVAAFSSEHGAPEERFYNLVCIAYGFDPKIFDAAVQKDYLPEARAKVCKFEYANLKFAVETMIMPHVDEALRQRVLATTVFPSDWQSGEWFP